MKNKKWLTLVELTLALIIAGTFVSIIMSLYTSIKWADMRLSYKRLLLWESSDLIDKIHDAALDYTIDYEEYFNRRILGFWVWDTWFTSYWNLWAWYYCSTWGVFYKYTHFKCGKVDKSNNHYYYCEQSNSGWCSDKYALLSKNYWFELPQKYWEYSFQHRKLSNLENLNSIDNMFANMRMWPVAIEPNTWLDYLYLINADGTERYYFRRVYSTWIDLDKDWELLWKNEKLYKVQMLRLRWFDIWSWYDCQSRWAYDWFIDTRACDSSQWYNCKGKKIPWTCDENNWSWYYLPSNSDDWRVDITSDRVTVTDMKIDIYPNKDPYLVWNETWLVYDPYAKISFTMNLYGKNSNEEITMTTTLSFKNSYTRFAPIQYTWYIPDEAY